MPVSERDPGRPLAEAPGEGEAAPDCWLGVAVAVLRAAPRQQS